MESVRHPTMTQPSFHPEKLTTRMENSIKSLHHTIVSGYDTYKVRTFNYYQHLQNKMPHMSQAIGLTNLIYK